jgi:hypothetical protein
MKTLFKLAIVILIVVVNLAIAQPSFADRPKISKNPEYVELTQAIDSLQAEEKSQGDSPELQQQIDELQIQKAAMESGITWGQCRNETGKTLAVYGLPGKGSKSSFDNELYFLANGESTPEGWDCNGIYLPNGIKIAGTSASQSLAYKIPNGTQLVATTDLDTDELALNVPPAKVFKAGDVNWTIPNLSQEFIESRIPSTLAAGEIDD